MADGLLTRSEVAAVLGMHPNAVVGLDNTGKLRAALRTPGGTRKWRAEDVATYKAMRDSRPPPLPGLCHDALRSLGGEATASQVMRVLHALGIRARQDRVFNSLDRLADRADPVAERVKGTRPQRWRLLPEEDPAEKAARTEREAPVPGAHHAGDLILG